MRNWTVIGLVTLVFSYVIPYPTSAGLPKDKMQGALQELAIPDYGAKEGLAGHIVVRDAPTRKGLEDRTQLAQAQGSNRCVTPVVICVLPVLAPVGSACWCATPYGPVGGVVR